MFASPICFCCAGLYPDTLVFSNVFYVLVVFQASSKKSINAYQFWFEIFGLSQRAQVLRGVVPDWWPACALSGKRTPELQNQLNHRFLPRRFWLAAFGLGLGLTFGSLKPACFILEPKVVKADDNNFCPAARAPAANAGCRYGRA